MTTLFQNALVYDGTEQPPQKACVLIADDRIVSITEHPVSADRVVDCTGLSLSPGLIDAHSHNDFFYDYDNALSYYAPFLLQGITTQVTGNCGFSPFGVDAQSTHKQEVGAGLFPARHAGSFKDFCNEARGQLYLNLAPLVGHGTTRIGVNGLSPKPLTPEQLEKELAAVDEAMENGALGGSFGFMYEPGMYATKDELVAFTKHIAQYDGIVTVHPRANSKVSMGYPLYQLKPHVELGLDEVIDIMKQSGCRMEYSHLILVGKSSWKCMDRMLQKIYQARKEGYDIAYDNYSMTYGASVITVICPPWYMALSKEEKRRPFNRLKLRLMIDITRFLLGIDYEDLTIAYLSDAPEAKQYEGRNVREIAESLHRDCFDVYLDLVDLSKGAGQIHLGKYYNDDLLRRLMEDDLSVFMTNAWWEPQGLQNGSTYQGFPNFFLLGRKFHIPTEKIVHKMTGKTAQRFRLKDRGFIRPGMKADLTLFDENAWQVFPEDSGKQALGIRQVYIAGQCVVEDGQVMAKKVGEVILRSNPIA